MQFRIEFESESAAFEGDKGAREVARILRDIGDMVTHGGIRGGAVMDPDGNTIGHWRYGRGAAARKVDPSEP